MSEVCALEIMEKNDMITVEEMKFKFIFVEKADANEAIDRTIVPAKKISILQKGEEFDRKFRDLMTNAGYVCMPGSNYAGGQLFFKKKDIDSFLDNLPEKEVLYTRPFPSAMSKYISKVKDERNLIVSGSEKVYTHHFFNLNENGSWSYQTKIKQCDVIKERLDKEKEQEQEAIEFMEQLF